MCLAASRKQRNRHGGGTRCSLPSPAAAVWKLLAAAADSHTLSFLLMLNTGNQSVLPVETVLWDDKRLVTPFRSRIVTLR